MEPFSPTMKSWTFELNLSGLADGMDNSTPPRLISTLRLPQGHQIQLQLICADDVEQNFVTPNFSHLYNLYQYQLVLDKDVDYPVKISAFYQTTTINHYGSLNKHLVDGNLADIQPEIPLPIVGLTYQSEMSHRTLDPADFKLLLNVHFPVPRTEDADVFPTGNVVADMRRHVELTGSLLSLGHFADCKFVTNDGKVYDCHKAILALKSEVFQKAFEGDMAEAKSKEIRIDCDSDMADLILPHFYTGQMPKVIKESAAELYRLAHLYHIEGLRAYLAEEILLRASQLVDVQNALESAVFGDKFDLKVFRQFCIKFIQENRREVVKLPQWKDFRSSNPDMIDEIMSV